MTRLYLLCIPSFFFLKFGILVVEFCTLANKYENLFLNPILEFLSQSVILCTMLIQVC